MTIDLNKMHAAALAATSGEWFGYKDQLFVYRQGDQKTGLVSSIMTVPCFVAEKMTAADVDFAVTCQPKAVLELLRMHDDLRNEIVSLQAQLDKYHRLNAELSSIMARRDVNFKF